MPQDQGPIQEPQISREDLALQAHNFDDLVQGTEDLDRNIKISINNTGLDLESLVKKWKGKEASWEELKGKKVLDLASGSALGKPQWRPYFSRLCANNGALVTAVDILPQVGVDRELFHGVQADLVPAVMKGRLAQVVGGESFDIVHSYSFIGSNPCPDLSEELSKLKVHEIVFSRALLEQSFRLLAEGGIIFLDEEDSKGEIYYTKKQGKLLQL